MSTETIAHQIPAGTWSADPVHSSIDFAITHSGVAIFRSGFDSFEAALSGGERPALNGSVAVDSVRIDEEQLKGHLLSPEFFDAASHPRLRFSSTELRVEEDGSARLAGELEIAGQARAVEASGRFGRVGAYLDGAERLGLSLEAKVDRRDFGLDWNAELPSGGLALEFEVTINVELELTAAEA